MKNLIMFTLSFITLYAQLANAQCSNHGGDDIGQEFYRIGLLLNQQIERLPPAEIAKFTNKFKPSMFKEALATALVKSVNRPLYVWYKNPLNEHGKWLRVTTKNKQSRDGTLMIKIDKNRWDQDRLDRKEAHVVHEYMSIIKYMHPEFGEWNEYSTASSLIDLISIYKKQSAEKSKSWITNLLAEFQKSSPNLSPAFGMKPSLEKNITYSCLEYSIQDSSLPPMVYLDLISSNSILSQLDADQKLSHLNNFEYVASTQSELYKEIRINFRGDLIIKKTDVKSKIDQKILFCSKEGSEVVLRTKKFGEALLAIFDRFTLFQKQIVQSSDTDLSRATFILEDANISYSKSKMNEWLATLGEQKSFYLEPIGRLYSQYLSHQNYFQEILNTSRKDQQLFLNEVSAVSASAIQMNRDKFLVDLQTAQESIVEGFKLSN